MEGKENKADVSPGQGVSEERGPKEIPAGKALPSLSRTLETCSSGEPARGSKIRGARGARPAHPADTEGGALRLGRGGGESPRALPSIPGSRLGGGPGSADFP